MSSQTFKLAAAAAMILVLAGCQLGQVEQGRVIAYDPSQGIVTLILDSNPSGPPRYDRLPPVQVKVPGNPSEMGPEPVPGKLLQFDVSPCQLTLYNEARGSIQAVPCQMVEVVEGVAVTDPRVTLLPRLDREGRRVTFYVPSRQAIVTVSVPDECFSLPADTWRFGDEVRYYFRDPEQALRMMNVTRTRLS